MGHSWDEGYRTETDYCCYYFNELNPVQLKFLLLAKGIVPPTIKNACELGFGQGLSINFHAVTSKVNWYGTDFMPTQVNFAQELANYAENTNVHLFDDSFAEFAQREDLPQFDYIALHGIWSWVSDENRKIIVDFIRRKLNVGGMLYISYNTLPGHNKTSPLRELLRLHATNCSAPNLSLNKKVDNALDFAEQVFKTSSIHCKDNPNVLAKLHSLRELDHNYLFHEYCNDNWCPMFFSDMAKWLEPAKLSFVCSATAFEHLDKINFSQEQNELFASVNNSIMEETLKDYIYNQQFRRDIWIKGPVTLTPTQRQEALKELSCILVSPKDEINGKVQCLLGDADFSDIYAAILHVLGDSKPHSLAKVFEVTHHAGFVFNHTVTALMSLYAKKHLLITREADEEIMQYSKMMNEKLLAQATTNIRISSLTSPFIGGAMNFNTIQFMLLYASKQLEGPVSYKKLVDFVWNLLATKGHKIVFEGKCLETDEENIAAIKDEALKFLKQLSVYNTLKFI